MRFKYQCTICILFVFCVLSLTVNAFPEPSKLSKQSKPGSCPITTGLIGECADLCQSDSDCPDQQKCCSNGCGYTCAPPRKGIAGSPNSCRRKQQNKKPISRPK